MPKKFSILTACLALFILAAPAGAQDRDEERDLPQARQEQDGEAEPAVSRRRVAEIVQERYQGRILRVSLEGRRWRVRMDDDGVVFNVFVDAMTGEVLEPEEDE